MQRLNIWKLFFQNNSNIFVRMQRNCKICMLVVVSKCQNTLIIFRDLFYLLNIIFFFNTWFLKYYVEQKSHRLSLQEINSTFQFWNGCFMNLYTTIEDYYAAFSYIAEFRKILNCRKITVTFFIWIKCHLLFLKYLLHEDIYNDWGLLCSVFINCRIAKKY